MKSGKTPLVRARNLEKKLNVGEIYLKLEGQNPTGHKVDRLAEVLVKTAIAYEYKQIIAYGSLNFILSVIHFAEDSGLKIMVPIFKNERWKNRFEASYGLDMKHYRHPDISEILMDLSNTKQAFLAAEGISNSHISSMVLESMMTEILERMNYSLDSMSIQLGYGYTMTSLYNSLLKGWMAERLQTFPSIYCGTWRANNEVYRKYIESFKVESLPDNLHEMTSEHMPKHAFHMDEKLLTDTLEAVFETKGILIPIDEDDLKSAARILKKEETIKVDYKEAYPLAAFIKKATSKTIKKGRHVIVLNDGKTIADIKTYNDLTDLTVDDLVVMTKEWLAEYRDSTLETREAIENAIQRGQILLASRNGNYEGICVIVNLGFDAFIPKYHLAYIGTATNLKGRGVGSELIQRAVDWADGNISLHVDLDNKNAKKVYEKYGFVHTYNRMIYKEEG